MTTNQFRSAREYLRNGQTVVAFRSRRSSELRSSESHTTVPSARTARTGRLDKHKH